MTPGRMALTRIACGPSSCAGALVRPITAALAAVCKRAGNKYRPLSVFKIISIELGYLAPTSHQAKPRKADTEESETGRFGNSCGCGRNKLRPRKIFVTENFYFQTG